MEIRQFMFANKMITRTFHRNIQLNHMAIKK